MPTQVSLLDGALASAGTLAIQTNGTTSAITISSAQVATFVNNPIMTGLTASRAVFTDGSKGLTSNAITGTGNVVMSASPTLTGTIDGAALTLSSSLTLSGGTANGVLYLNGSKVATSGSALTFDGSNLGLGVTPSAWLSTTKVMQLGQSAVLFGRTASNQVQFGSNFYIDASAVTKYIQTDYASKYVQDSGQHQWYTAASGTAGNAITFTQAMTLDASGNLGIGTTSPSTRLHAKGSGGTIATFERDASGTIAYFNRNAGSGNAGAIIGADSVAGYFAGGNSTNNMVYLDSVNNLAQFYTNGTERARITSGGYFKASNTGSYRGSTATYNEFYQTANDSGLAITCTNTSQTTNCLRVFAARNTTNNSYYAIDYYNDGADTVRFRVADSGNVTNTNNSYGAISDIKLKENITDATPKLAGLMQVRVRNYNLKSDPTQKQLGVIAQELEQVFPGMVEESPDRDADGNDLGTTTKQVKYSVFVPMLIKAIQEQQAIIEQLKADVAALKGA